MANTLKFKRGLVGTIPTAALGEPLFTTDTFDLYIGNGTGNTRFQKFIASGTTSQLLRGDGSLLTMPIVLTSPSNGQVLKYNGTNWVNDSDAGITGSGTTNYLPKFTGATTLGNSTLQEVNGNLGLGSAPSNWTSFKALQIGGNSFVGFGTQAEIWNNSFFDGTFKYYGNGFATRYTAIDGNFQWYIAPNNVSGSGASATFTQAARITSGGNFIINNPSTDNGLRFQVTGDGYFSGSVGIGTSSLTGYGVRNSRTITGALACYGFSVDGTIQSDATSSINIFNSVPATQAAAFNIGSLIHFIANQGTQGSGSTISNQYGFLAQAGLTGATNNYGFYGNIASGTGRWNLYMNGTAANYLAGSLWIGTTSGNHPLEVASASNTILYIRAGATSLSRLVFGTSTNADRGFIDYDNTAASRNMSFKIAETERMRLDASGNLGLGVTPSTWAASRSKIEFSSAGTTAGFVGCFAGSSANNQMGLGSNAYYNASSVWTYSNTGGGAGYYGILNNIHQWHIAPSGTAGNAITFTQAMTLDASGNLGLGGTPSAWGTNERAFQLRGGGTAYNPSIAYIGGEFELIHNAFYNGTNYVYTGTGYGSTRLRLGIQGAFQFFTTGNVSGSAGATPSYTQAMTLFATGNLGIGVTSDATYKLDVNGTMRVSGASTFGGLMTVNAKIQSGTRAFIEQNGTGDADMGASTGGVLTLYSQGISRLLFNSSGQAVFNTNVVNGVIIQSGGINVTGAATFSSSVTAASFNGTTNNIFSVSGTEGMRLTSTGLGIAMTPSYKLDVTGQARISDAIAIGTTPDTNLPFKILKNINSTVGIRFENTNTGSSAFSGYQFGTDVTTGTAFTNFLYASSGVVESGVYKPNGTALINTGSGGLNFLAVSQPIRFFTSTGNGTLRAAITNDGDFTQYNGTNPSASTTDAFRMYSADITAGNAAPHFRTENGGIIKLYQQTTAVTSATYIGGAGTTVTDLDTFDGYTIAQIVKALRNAGLLA